MSVDGHALTQKKGWDAPKRSETKMSEFFEIEIIDRALENYSEAKHKSYEQPAAVRRSSKKGEGDSVEYKIK